MNPISPAAKQLLLINVLLFLATVLLPKLQLAHYLILYFPGSEFFRPMQLVTHMFMHAGPSHLLFNMLGLYMFGTELEYRLGTKKFLLLYFIAGFGAMLLHLGVIYLDLYQLEPEIYTYAINQLPGMLGASGAIFGLLAAFGMLFPDRPLMLLFFPVPIPAKIFVVLYGALELFFGVRGIQPGVAHFAHVGGALFGFILILYWRRQRMI